MTDFKLYGKCKGCGRRRFFIRKNVMDIEGVGEVKGRDLLCGPCIRKVRGSINK